MRSLIKRRQLRPLYVTGALLFAWVLGASALDLIGRAHTPSGRWDAIVVPGSKVWRGGVPSKALRRRVDRAVSLFKEGYAPELVLTGGVGKFAPAEAIAAAKYAEAAGVPSSALRIEARSQSTLENARFSHALIGDKSVLVVTDAYHVLRCRLIFGYYFPKVQLVGVPLGKTPPWGDSLREVLALAWFFVTAPMLL